MKSEMEQRLVETWLAASRDLGIRVVAPFVLTVNGRERQYIALVPDFGNRKGILVTAHPFDAPSHEIASFAADAFNDAKSAGYGCSVINPAQYVTYERQHFVDTLVEWGFTGSPDARPPWMPPIDN